jgi:hypothetical protein
MKKLLLSVLSVALLALSACGGSAEPAEGSTEPELTTRRTPDATPEGRTFELRLQGTNATGYDSVRVPIRSLEVTAADGEALSVRQVAPTVDLTVVDQAYLVGEFFVPQDLDSVRVKLILDEVGSWRQGTQAGALDTQAAPMSFEAPMDALAEHGRAVVLLDIGQSLQPSSIPEQRLLLPHLQVNY